MKLLKSIKTSLIISCLIPGLASAGNWTPTLAASGVLPACSTNKVTPFTAAFGNDTSGADSWQFFSCAAGAKYLAITVRKIRLFGADGSVVVVFDKTNDSSLEPVDIIANPLNLLKDADISSLIGNSFAIDKIEITFDNIVRANSTASHVDQFGTKLQCGTTSTQMSGGVYDNTKASPISSAGGTGNGRSFAFYQKHGSGKTQGPSWIAIDTFNLVPPGFQSDGRMFVRDSVTGSVNSGLYSTAMHADLSESASPTIKYVSMQAVDASNNLSGYIWNSSTGAGGYNTKYIVSTMQLRTPLALKAKSKFNIDLKLDVSQMFAWGFYYSTNSGSTISSNNTNNGSAAASIYTDDCLQLFIGPMLLKVKKVAIKDD